MKAASVASFGSSPSNINSVTVPEAEAKAFDMTFASTAASPGSLLTSAPPGSKATASAPVAATSIGVDS